MHILSLSNALPLLLAITPAVSATSTSNNHHFLTRAVHHTKHALIARAHAAHVLARDVRMAIEGLGFPAPPHLKKRAQPGGARCRVQQSVQSVSGSGGVGSGGFSNVTGSSSSETQSGHSTSATSSKSASSQSAKSSSSSSSSSSQASATPSSGPPPFTLVNGYVSYATRATMIFCC